MQPPGISQAPVLLQAVNDTFTMPCRIMALVWYGSTSSGDSVEIRDRQTGEILWGAFTDTTKTYLGINLSSLNVGCQGFRCTGLSSGKVLVYLAQAQS